MYENRAAGVPAACGNIRLDGGVKERERPPLDHVLSVLGDSLANVGRLIESVDIRFGPVCRPSPPMPLGNGAAVPGIGGSAIVNIIEGHIAEARRLEARLEDILSRCEV